MPRPNTPLDMIKFLCKDLWMLVFKKQIDNLKTNHRGTFVLTDSRFQPLARMSVDRGRGARGLEEALSKAQPVSLISFHLSPLPFFPSLYPLSPALSSIEMEEEEESLVCLTPYLQFLWFPCGIIRGALSGFGLNVVVQAETTDLKGAVFQIRTVGSKP